MDLFSFLQHGKVPLASRTIEDSNIENHQNLLDLACDKPYSSYESFKPTEIRHQLQPAKKPSKLNLEELRCDEDTQDTAFSIHNSHGTPKSQTSESSPISYMQAETTYSEGSSPSNSKNY
mmetsp:Transcript_27473/g.24217  ORF Transcript_27473/g.24217 Transcript_27473/m.24217 type:complete len:120 (-) Transcript_27473:464-823(-)